MNRVAIQGILGSFHHQVALEYFGDSGEMVCCMSFDKLADTLSSGKADFAVMAIENSIAGSIIPNYTIIDDAHFSVVGEHYIVIRHHLLALEGQQIEDIHEVYSHPMALLQCKVFLKQYPHIKRIETSDTAAEAQRIAQHNLKGIAAIAGIRAAEIYRLQTIASSIQTIDNNMTRFLILKRSIQDEISTDKKEINKASIRFVLDHKRGSLATVLNVMSDCKLNLTKIQSLPIIKQPWNYAFFVDVTFDEYDYFDKAQQVLKIMSDELKILGVYKNKRI